MIANGSIWMRGKVIEQHGAGGLGVFCGRGLIVGDFIESNNDGRVAASGIIEKKAGDLLDPVNTGLVQ